MLSWRIKAATLHYFLPPYRSHCGTFCCYFYEIFSFAPLSVVLYFPHIQFFLTTMKGARSLGVAEVVALVSNSVTSQWVVCYQPTCRIIPPVQLCAVGLPPLAGLTYLSWVVQLFGNSDKMRFLLMFFLEIVPWPAASVFLFSICACKAIGIM